MATTLLLSILFASTSAEGYYRAELEAAPARERFVARGNVWRCAGSACASPRSQTRPAIACAALAREAGRLTSFSVAGTPFDAEALENCNSRAR